MGIPYSDAEMSHRLHVAKTIADQRRLLLDPAHACRVRRTVGDTRAEEARQLAASARAVIFAQARSELARLKVD